MEEEYKKIYRQIYSRVLASENILLLTHEKPDGDGLSSVCATIDWLKEINKIYKAYCFDEPPAHLSYLPHISDITSDKESLDFNTFDLIMVFDCGDLRRTRLSDEINKRRKDQIIINLDHHPKVDEFADLEIKDPSATSTAELVYDFFKVNKIRINKERANCLLTGISSDTGNFIYSATSDKTVKISSELLMRGGNLPQIIENTWRNKSLPAMKIWGQAMANLRINKKYNIAFTVLTMRDISESGIGDDEMEGIANFLGNLKDVKAVMLLREQSDGTIKGSFRSAHPTVNISPLARLLGGGGHSKAAGFRVEGRLKQTDGKWEVL